MKRRHALGAPPGRFVTPAQKRRILERDGHQCAYCHIPLEYADAVVDHRTPWAKGGLTKAANLAACCRNCNRLKGNLTEKQFRFLLEGLASESA